MKESKRMAAELVGLGILAFTLVVATVLMAIFEFEEKRRKKRKQRRKP